ncbi:MAG: aminoacetone oxidase family FAD-binding enzyme, partial [Chitinophagaceae bacterium]|nr:aminoacetone oxidase family FAD-binding enzyme [Chitinophagaceae bacterium]
MRVAIIGAGAGGCFAAANLKRQGGMEIFVFEKTSKALQKVKVSGGGRCNVTHACFDIPKLVERYPRGNRFLRKTLHRFTPQHTIAWFEEREVSLKTEDDGRMFPVTDDSQTIIDCIWGEMMKNKVQVRYHKAVERIEKVDEQLMITFKDETSFLADRVIIACGGFAKKEQFSWLEHLGHTIEYPVPSLFTFNLHKNPITELMGVSVANVTVKIAGTKLTEHGPLLITHWGFSGPAILKCSAWGARILSEHGYDFIVLINWLG